MGKSNSGSSMPNQGDRGSTSGKPGSAKPAKYGASVHKTKGLKNPRVPPTMT